MAGGSLKIKIASAIVGLSIDRLISRLQKEQGVVLLFHRVGDNGSPLWPALSTDSFRAILRFAKSEFDIVSIKDLAKGQKSGRRVAAVSFDDGFKDFYTHAWPILQEEGFTAVNHNLIPASIETGLPPWTSILHAVAERPDLAGGKLLFERKNEETHVADFKKYGAMASYQSLYKILCKAPLPDVVRFIEERLMPLVPKLELPAMMSRAEIAALHKEGMEIGVHGYRHLMLQGCNSGAELNHEVLGSKIYLEQTFGCICDTFAFPNGIYDTESMKAVKKAGYDHILTAGSRLSQSEIKDPKIIPRTSIHHDYSSINRLRIALRLP